LLKPEVFPGPGAAQGLYWASERGERKMLGADGHLRRELGWSESAALVEL
jgi:hypothetical protein